jgi:hypothetical protein
MVDRKSSGEEFRKDLFRSCLISKLLNHPLANYLKGSSTHSGNCSKVDSEHSASGRRNDDNPLANFQKSIENVLPTAHWSELLLSPK